MYFILQGHNNNPTVRQGFREKTRFSSTAFADLRLLNMEDTSCVKLYSLITSLPVVSENIPTVPYGGLLLDFPLLLQMNDNVAKPIRVRHRLYTMKNHIRPIEA